MSISGVYKKYDGPNYAVITVIVLVIITQLILIHLRTDVHLTYYVEIKVIVLL